MHIALLYVASEEFPLTFCSTAPIEIINQEENYLWFHYIYGYKYILLNSNIIIIITILYVVE